VRRNVKIWDFFVFLRKKVKKRQKIRRRLLAEVAFLTTYRYNPRQGQKSVRLADMALR